MDDTAAPEPMEASEGRHPGFEAFYREEHVRLVTSLLLGLGDLDAAHEAADEAFLRALVAWPRVQTMDSPAGWTYRVAINVARRRGRRRAVEQRLWLHKRAPSVVPAPAGEAWDLVRHLPDRQRMAVVLRFVADLTEPQIATAMGVSRSTVSSTLADANRALARQLEPDHDPLGDRHG